MISICYENWIVFSFQCTSSLKFRIRPFASSSRRIREVRSSYWASNKAESGLSSSFSVDFFTCSLPFALVFLLFLFFLRTRRESALSSSSMPLRPFVKVSRSASMAVPVLFATIPAIGLLPEPAPNFGCLALILALLPPPPHLLWRGYTLCPPPLPHPPPHSCSLSVAPGLAHPPFLSSLRPLPFPLMLRTWPYLSLNSWFWASAWFLCLCGICFFVWKWLRVSLCLCDCVSCSAFQRRWVL